MWNIELLKKCLFKIFDSKCPYEMSAYMEIEIYQCWKKMKNMSYYIQIADDWNIELDVNM